MHAHIQRNVVRRIPGGKGADSSSAVDTFQKDHLRIHQDFTGVLEIDGYTVSDDRLDLTVPPFRLAGMTDPGAGLKKDRHRHSLFHSRPVEADHAAVHTHRPHPFLRQGRALTMQDPLLLAELLATRLCHDISSPLNTVAGALEEVGGSARHQNEALTLAQDAAEVLTRRLVLLRAAWGGVADPIDAEGLTRMASGLPGRPVTLDLSGVAPGAAFAPPMARLLLNVLLLAAEGLPRGGRVAIASPAEGEAVVVIDGLRAAWPAALVEAIANPESVAGQISEATPRSLQGPMTVLIAAQAGMFLSFLMGAQAESAPPLMIRPVAVG